MATCNVSGILAVLSLLSFLSLTSGKLPTYHFHRCSSETFTPNSTYQINLNHLLSYLSSNTTQKNGFYNTTAGQSPATTVYGHFFCRGDLPTAVCSDCVRTATKEIVQQYCPAGKESWLGYLECVLHYSNRSLLSTNGFPWCLRSSMSATEPKRFLKLVNSTLNDLVSRAANSPSGAKKFVTIEVNFTKLQTFYSLVQCIPVISSTACDSCLRKAITKLPTYFYGKQGGRVWYPTCDFRFELYPFYQMQPTPAPAPAPMLLSPTPERVTRPEGGIALLKVIVISIGALVAVSLVLLAVSCYFLERRAASKRDSLPDENGTEVITIESLQFDLATIEAATNKFSNDRRVGGGGFGEVYKGVLPNGQEIAVKRLSKSTTQAIEDFKNEVMLVAKLLHRNLVKLLGFCIQEEKTILVYEFVANKSLDYFLYDLDKQRLLDWPTRYKIIKGIVRGILYLHEDSRVKVIHRDLKASNILLDKDMNPKISDFGVARIFGADQTEGTTNTIVGTCGYISPEYAMHGQFSMKSDVYSFGVLLLEILSGNNNGSFNSLDNIANLLAYAWEHWSNGMHLEFLDPSLRDSYSEDEVIRCIHIGLLCVQENPDDRPTMATIDLMLKSYSTSLPSPQYPAFFHPKTTEPNTLTKDQESTQPANKIVPYSANEAPITGVYPR